jgi:hypothetical protein
MAATPRTVAWTCAITDSRSRRQVRQDGTAWRRNRCAGAGLRRLSQVCNRRVLTRRANGSVPARHDDSHWYTMHHRPLCTRSTTTPMASGVIRSSMRRRLAGLISSQKTRRATGKSTARLGHVRCRCTCAQHHEPWSPPCTKTKDGCCHDFHNLLLATRIPLCAVVEQTTDETGRHGHQSMTFDRALFE